MTIEKSKFTFSKKIRLPQKEIGINEIDVVKIEYRVTSETFPPNENNDYEQKTLVRDLELYYFREGGRRWQQFKKERWKRADTGEVTHDWDISKQLDNQSDLEIDVCDAIIKKVPPYIAKFLEEIKESESQR